MNPSKYELMLQNTSELSCLDLRSINRYHLHPQNKRICSQCKVIFTGFRENFHIQKYTKPNDSSAISWNSICKTCFNSTNRERTAKYREDYSKFIKMRFTAYLYRAKEKNVAFDLDAEYLVSLFKAQNELCYYTNQLIDFKLVTESTKHPHNNTPSLDRLIPELGYVKGNVVWCAYYINRMKNDIPYNEFISLCETIINIQGIRDENK